MKISNGSHFVLEQIIKIISDRFTVHVIKSLYKQIQIIQINIYSVNHLGGDRLLSEMLTDGRTNWH
jgi:hypothetical protein